MRDDTVLSGAAFFYHTLQHEKLYVELLNSLIRLGQSGRHEGSESALSKAKARKGKE